MISVGVINVTGYLGAEAARLLRRHPRARLTSEEVGDVDVVISALPHAASAAALLPFIDRGLPVVDLSADFRLKSASEYEAWYGIAHPRPEALERSVYGLTELRREAIAASRLVAGPGCFPTSAILALAPAWRAGLITADIIVDSKTGTSGG